MASDSATPPFPLFSQLSAQPYGLAEDTYLSELTAYTRKQFFQVHIFFFLQNFFLGGRGISFGETVQNNNYCGTYSNYCINPP